MSQRQTMPDPKEFPTLESQHVFELAGGYPVMRVIGQGGMGRVFACRDQALGRIVAVKVMLPEVATDKQMVARFLREARAMARVASPHVVSIFHVGDGTEGDPPFIVMEYLDGEDLEARVRRTGKVPVARTLDYMRDAAHGLRAASHVGLVHRDVKPANLVVADGRVILTDFGLAKPVDGSADLTQKGLLAGSPHFMPPERARGDEEDHRADIYSLGATWYTLLTGTVPFDKATPVDTITAHLAEEPRPIHELSPEVTPEVERIVMTMMAKNPVERFASYDDLINAIESVQQSVDPDAGPHEPRKPAAVVVAPDGSERRVQPQSAGFKKMITGASSAVSGAMNRAKKEPAARNKLVAAAAVGVSLVVLVVVLALTTGDDRLARIDGGQAQAVLDEIQAIDRSQRTGTDHLLAGHALVKLDEAGKALKAYEDAAEQGTLDERVLEHALAQLLRRKADTAIKLLIAWPDTSVNVRLYELVESDGWWPRHHAVRVLTDRGADDKIDRQRLAIIDLDTGDKCGMRRYGLRQLKKVGQGPEALAAIARAAERGDNKCLSKEIADARKAVVER
jgi:serine/threonine protein kinase